MPTVHVYLNGTNVRAGGCLRSDPDNVLTTIPAGDYNAHHQSVGDDVKRSATVFNYWWVKIDTPAGPGWVSATRVSGGDNNGPVPHVPKHRTEFV